MAKKLKFSRTLIFANFVIIDIFEIFTYIYFRELSSKSRNSRNLMSAKINVLKVCYQIHIAQDILTDRQKLFISRPDSNDEQYGKAP